ncbi:hypothetical protein BBP00_00005658 [Phytophthora kernoviae]|uniref:Cyclic nucleotide-binding domain-containing protein n=1 Tax=Phytophthora kernoviae TaxID=325452 RepID=A0A3F2RNY7_9STRA|nr:hypothetical protein BBP00_00005658 [Phytophthora kernoviae]
MSTEVTWSKEQVLKAFEDSGNLKVLEHVNLSNTNKCSEESPVYIFYMRGLQCSRDPRLAYHFWANFAGRHQFHLFTGQPKDECIHAAIYLYVPSLDEIEKSLKAVADELKDTKFAFERINRGGETTVDYPQEKWHELFDTDKYDHLKVNDPYGNELYLNVTPRNFSSINLSLGKKLPVTNDVEGVAQGFPFMRYPCRPGIAQGISRFFEHYLGAKTVVTKKEGNTELYRTTVFCGPLQAFVFDELESERDNKGEYDGHHVCIHIDRFKEFYDLAHNESMTWNNVLFFDRCDTWFEANRDQQYRILHLIDPVDKKFLMSFEMEIRSAQHFRYLIHRSDVTPEEEEANEVLRKKNLTNKIFQGAQEIICKTICREMTLLELPTKGVVCYQGDYGDTFFVIISGSVSLFINPNPKPKVILDEDNNPTLADDDEVKLLPDQYGTFIKHITDGGTFGELAVMDPTARRSCTIVCDEPTTFICLKRGSYQRLIRITNSSQLDFTQIEFLETIYFFDGWPHGELTRLSNRLRQVHYPVDSYLTRIGADANVVFFIYAGLVQETVPMIQQLNENGSVQRSAELESNLVKLTDVKALVMDRETWKDLFYMHALDHIRASFNKLRKLAEARENWRKTRVKLALANPGLILTMMASACVVGAETRTIRLEMHAARR